jgi:hypothetical protein
MAILQQHNFHVNLSTQANREHHLVLISGVFGFDPPRKSISENWTTEGEAWIGGFVVGPEWIKGRIRAKHCTAIVVLGSIDGSHDPYGWAVDDWKISIVDSDESEGAEKILLDAYVRCRGEDTDVNRVSFFVTAKGDLLNPVGD